MYYNKIRGLRDGRTGDVVSLDVVERVVLLGIKTGEAVSVPLSEAWHADPHFPPRTRLYHLAESPSGREGLSGWFPNTHFTIKTLRHAKANRKIPSVFEI
jgi:hypothetical protein